MSFSFTGPTRPILAGGDPGGWRLLSGWIRDRRMGSTVLSMTLRCRLLATEGAHVVFVHQADPPTSRWGRPGEAWQGNNVDSGETRPGLAGGEPGGRHGCAGDPCCDVGSYCWLPTARAYAWRPGAYACCIERSRTRGPASPSWRRDDIGHSPSEARHSRRRLVLGAREPRRVQVERCLVLGEIEVEKGSLRRLLVRLREQHAPLKRRANLRAA